MSNIPDRLWGDIDTDWRAIPAKEITQALEMMNTRCKELFADRLHSVKVRSVIIGRLYQTRRSWQNKQRQKRRAENADEESAVVASSSSVPKSGAEVVDRRNIMAVSSLLQDQDQEP